MTNRSFEMAGTMREQPLDTAGRQSGLRRQALRRAEAILGRAVRSVSESRLRRALDQGSDTSFITELLSAEAAHRPGSALEAAIERARERGRMVKAEVLAQPNMLSSDQVAALLGMTRQGVDRRRRQGRLLALQGERRGYRYPAWQFEGGQVLPGLAEAMARLEDHPWTKYRFFLIREASLGDRTPLEALRAGEVDAVLRTAEFFGEQGGG
jgi:hypothetical protein